MQIRFEERYAHIGPVTVPLSRHVILSLIGRCARFVSALRSHAPARWTQS